VESVRLQIEVAERNPDSLRNIDWWEVVESRLYVL